MAADAASITGRIGQAIEAVVRGLRLAPAPTNYARRKMLKLLDGDGERLVIIAVGDDEQFEPLCTGSKGGMLLWSVKRTCGIALGYASGGKAGDNADIRLARNKIWSAITATTLQRAGCAEVNDVMPAGRSIFANESTPGVDWSVVNVTVETLEERPL